MKNLNSKKARQELSDLINSIGVMQNRMNEQAGKMKEKKGDYEPFIKWKESKKWRDIYITVLVETFEIPHCLYVDVKREARTAQIDYQEIVELLKEDNSIDEPEVVENYNYNDYGLDEWDIR